MIPRSPTGDGEAMSRSAPLQGWSFSIPLQNVLWEVVAPPGPLHLHRTSATGDGEHLSLPEPVGWSHLGSGAKPQFSDYFHHLHQRRLLGAVSTAWAVCSKTCSSWTSRRRASSSSPWAWTWVWSAITKASRLLSWPFAGLGTSSTSQRYPWGVGFWWAVSSPLPMRRRIVSVDTPKRRAASPTDTFSTISLLFRMGNSIGLCIGICLVGAQAQIDWFEEGPPW